VAALVDNELVHTARAEGGRNRLRDGETGRNVGQQLGRALRRVGALCTSASVYLGVVPSSGHV
jgi:hypothetical protein